MDFSYALFTDTSSELLSHQAKALNLDGVLPIGCVFQDGTVFDDMDDVNGFYQKQSLENMASTSGVNQVEIIERFTPYLEAGRDILYLPISRSLSEATFAGIKNAKETLGKEYPDRRILCPDNVCVSGGLAMLVRRVSEMREQGKSLDEVLDYVDNNNLQFAHDFTLDSLDYLLAGGRISKGAKILGNLLNVRPVMYFSDEGELQAIGKKKGIKSTLTAIADKIQRDILLPEGGLVTIYHGNAPEKSALLEQLIRERLPHVVIENIHRIGPVIGAHVGPTVVAAFYEAKGRKTL